MADFLRLFRPAEYYESVVGIDIADLRDRGIEALLTDLDNTLVPWQSRDISPEVTNWVRNAVESGMKLCIVSNTRSWGRLRDLANQFGIAFVGKTLKPRRGGFREALGMLDVSPKRAAVIGDQIFTDILGGNRLGLHTILVRPLNHREFVGTKISRFFERILLGSLRPKSASGSSNSETSQGNNRGKPTVR